MSKPVLFDELSRVAIEKLVASGMKTVIMPVGAVEQHGPHLPVKLDYMCAEEIARGVSARTGVPVLPALPFGHSGGHKGFPGVIALRPETFQKVCEEIAEWIYASGFRQLVFLNGHLPNVYPLMGAIVNLMRDHEDFQLKALSWWDIDPEIGELMMQDKRFGLPHANDAETALMRYLRDDLVDMSLAKESPGENQSLFFAYLIHKITPDGTLGDPRSSTVEFGEKLYNLAVDKLSAQLEAARNEVPPFP